MALSCQVSLNYSSCLAGQTPPPMANLQVYNPNASAVVVTSVSLYFTDRFGTPVQAVMNPALPPIGPGQTTSVPALSSINIGPMSITMGSAANENPFQMVPQSTQPTNPQRSQPQRVVLVGALVYGSDGSVNVAGVAALLVMGSVQPPLGYQGGFLMFDAPNNFIGWTPGWP